MSKETCIGLPGLDVRAMDFAIPKRELNAKWDRSECEKENMGKVNIRLTADKGSPDEVKLFFTPHVSEPRKQRIFVAKTGKNISVDLPAGEYTAQILARGFDTVRGLVTIDPKNPFLVEASLKPRTKKPSTFEERLAKYGINASRTEIGDLNVQPRTTRVLNYKNDCEKRGCQMLYADSIGLIKKWVGSDDAQFGHERPVYGPLPASENLTRMRETGIDLRKLGNNEVQAIAAIGREYVYGNSTAVKQYESLLNEVMKLSTRVGMMKMIPIYFYRVVTIGAGSFLEIGQNSAIFTCDELRIHKTGQLRPVASVKIEIGTYTEFG